MLEMKEQKQKDELVAEKEANPHTSVEKEESIGLK